MLSNNTQNLFANISSEQLEETQDYMNQHRLPNLFQHLTAALLFHRPGGLFTMECVEWFDYINRLYIEDPRAFMIDQLEQLKSFKLGTTNEVCYILYRWNWPSYISKQLPLLLFNKENLIAMFRTMDLTGTGYISLDQFHKGMSSVLSSIQWISCRIYHTAMKNIGVTMYNRFPQGYESNKIGLGIFLEEAYVLLFTRITKDLRWMMRVVKMPWKRSLSNDEISP